MIWLTSYFGRVAPTQRHQGQQKRGKTSLTAVQVSISFTVTTVTPYHEASHLELFKEMPYPGSSKVIDWFLFPSLRPLNLNSEVSASPTAVRVQSGV